MFTLYSSHDDDFCVFISSKKHALVSDLSSEDLYNILDVLDKIKSCVEEDLYIKDHELYDRYDDFKLE